MKYVNFENGDEIFKLNHPDNYTYLYFPVAGEQGIKSSISPNLGGDSKIDQNTFILEPESNENLHNNKSTRNFWCYLENKGSWSATGASAEAEFVKFTDAQEECDIEAGYMWQTITRTSAKYQLKSKVTSFVPVNSDVEVMKVVIENTSDKAQTIVPTAAIPVYGRSADNIRDHRHVTSLLHQIKTTQHGVEVKPKLSFDERGHQKNNITYFVYGVSGKGEAPVSFFPVAEDYIGEGGSYIAPLAVKNNLEAKVDALVEDLKKYWEEKVNVYFHTGNKTEDSYLRWICFQPILRRIYGCSFLPHHDYGKGGRGWRDLWQDCLSLLFMNPDGVRQTIVDSICMFK